VFQLQTHDSYAFVVFHDDARTMTEATLQQFDVGAADTPGALAGYLSFSDTRHGKFTMGTICFCLT
jgi:hypothetical protein